MQPGLQQQWARFLNYLFFNRTELASSELSAKMCKKVTSLDQGVGDRWSFPRFLNFRNANADFYFLSCCFAFQKTMNSQVLLCLCE